ncbi:unnamed protein product [Callosobruchus maculatus]|uniref:Uncharacterized protein n=1 Tax=Callosobruchus maculatus TaxID=64391 RepID=A0A653BIY4_CALMS|nr:unnamed protein product [Callosobruchus maculatus]
MHLDHVYLSHLSWPSSRSHRSRRRNIRETVARLLCSRQPENRRATPPWKIRKNTNGNVEEGLCASACDNVCFNLLCTYHNLSFACLYYLDYNEQ